MKARGEVKRPSIHPVREGEGGEDIFHALQGGEVRSQSHRGYQREVRLQPGVLYKSHVGPGDGGPRREEDGSI